jgi:hypothetical protein
MIFSVLTVLVELGGTGSDRAAAVTRGYTNADYGNEKPASPIGEAARKDVQPLGAFP